ncbi:MAG: response regulator, partial [Chloroflexi bacterium]
MPPSTRPLRRWCGTSRRSSGSALPRLCGRTDASALQTGCVRATRRAPVTGFHPRSSSVPSRFSESLDTCNGRRYLCLPDRIREVSCVAAAGWCDARLGAEHRRVSFRHPVEQEGIVIHLPGESRRTPRPAAVERAPLLVIEDSPGDAELVQALLRRSAVRQLFDVTSVPSLADAMPLLEEAACVLLDLALPDAEGLDGLRAVRLAAPDVPVVVLTGYADEDLGLEALREGAQDYLVKGEIDGRQL